MRMTRHTYLAQLHIILVAIRRTRVSISQSQQLKMYL